MNVESLCFGAVTVIMPYILINNPSSESSVIRDGILPEMISEFVRLAVIHHEGQLSKDICYAFETWKNVFMFLSYASRDAATHSALMHGAEALLWATANGRGFVGMDVLSLLSETLI